MGALMVVPATHFSLDKSINIYDIITISVGVLTAPSASRMTSGQVTVKRHQRKSGSVVLSMPKRAIWPGLEEIQTRRLNSDSMAKCNGPFMSMKIKGNETECRKPILLDY
jgi:hypothetical protein